MSPARLSEEEVVALARMARGGVHLDREGRGLLGGEPVIRTETVTALAAADLIHVAAAAGVPHLTRAGRAVLADAALAALRPDTNRLTIRSSASRPSSSRR